jgi:hypothetical protein
MISKVRVTTAYSHSKPSRWAKDWRIRYRNLSGLSKISSSSKGLLLKSRIWLYRSRVLGSFRSIMLQSAPPMDQNFELVGSLPTTATSAEAMLRYC